MRLHEITTAPGNDMKRLVMLRLMVERGHKPEIADASFSKGHFSWGDLEKLGYAKRESKKSRHGANERWIYTGPTPIVLIQNVNGEERRMEMIKGDVTDGVEVDYS